MASAAAVVLGSDHTALAVAAQLALDGRRVILWETAPAPGSAARCAGGPRVTVSGRGGQVVATLAAATADPFEALAADNLLLVAEASHTDGALVDLVVPLLEPRHTLVLLAGGLGSLALAKWLRDRGRTDMPTLVESDGMHVLSGRVAADHVQVHAVVDRPGFGVFPSGRTSRTIDGLRCLFPGAHAHQNVVAAALASVTTFLRQATLLMNMATVERLGADHRVFDVGFTPSVARVVEALDRERLAIAAALELHLSPAAEALHERGLSPQGDLWAAVHGSYPLTRLPAAGTAVAGESLEEARRFFDVWVELAAKLDVPVPTYRALADLGRAVTGAGSAEAGSALESLGIAGMPVGGLVRFLETGG